MAKRNIHRIDDWLIRTGYLVLALAFFGNGCADVFMTAGTGAHFTGGWMLAAVSTGGVALLAAGYLVRNEERRISAIWDILEHATEVSIEELLHATGHSRDFLLRAVRIINRQPGAYYVWDEAAGTIVDGRMRSKTVVLERCESCGAGIHLLLSIDLPQVPHCEHCGSPVTARDLTQLKHDTVRELRASARQPGHDFSVLLFLVLLIIFWPAAVVYAVWTTGLFDDVLGRARAL